MYSCCLQLLALALCLLSASGTALSEPNSSPATSDVFRIYSPRVVQVRILEKNTGVKTTIGSGFYVDDRGLVVTNYHVISKMIFEGERHQIDIVKDGGGTEPAALLHFDVVHDLALLQAKNPAAESFTLHDVSPQKGERLFSLGNPRDLGFSIVEGTYNGIIDNSLHDRIHFTGSLNPGASGGPALTTAGDVAGINVSGYGEQVSFLVPVRFALALLNEAHDSPETLKLSLEDRLREQLLRNQLEYVAKILAKPVSTVSLASYQVPTEILPNIKCWSSSEERASEKYASIVHQCATDDYVFVSDRLRSQQISMYNAVLSSHELNPAQFYDLVESTLERYNNPGDRDQDDVTNFQCTEDLVNLNGSTQKLAFCARAYKKLKGLYDVVVLGASNDSNSEALIVWLSSSGVSFESGKQLSRHFLEHIAWKNS